LGHARVAVAVALAALTVPTVARAEIAATPSAHAIVTLEPDGVVELLEQMNVHANAPTAAAWEVAMQPGELFAEPAMTVDGRRYRGADGRPGTFRIARGTNGVRFEWRQPRGATTTRLAYRLALVGTAYSDVVDLRVPVWEGDWPAGVRRLTAAVKLPRRAGGRVRAWVEDDALTARVQTTRRDVRVHVTDVPARTPVTLRVVVPRDVLDSLSAVNVRPEPGLESILAERDGDGERAWWPWALGGALVLAVSAVGLRTARLHRLRPR